MPAMLAGMVTACCCPFNPAMFSNKSGKPGANTGGIDDTAQSGGLKGPMPDGAYLLLAVSLPLAFGAPLLSRMISAEKGGVVGSEELIGMDGKGTLH